MIDLKTEILQQLPITTVLQRFGLKMQHGFINCPFHKDDTASCRIYTRTNTFYCFGCGAGGNVIDFAIGWYHLDFKAAMEQLNETFALGLPIGRKMTIREKRELTKRAADATKSRAETDAIRAAAFQRYWLTMDLWRALCRCREIYKPKTPLEPLHPMFVHAITHIDAAEDAFAEAESEVIRLGSG
ncbi:MAG: hypothetical protein IKN72_03800 [Clostridia bacterium]|nr:hypothetical protein [Clostridia bacterium]